MVDDSSRVTIVYNEFRTTAPKVNGTSDGLSTLPYSLAAIFDSATELNSNAIKYTFIKYIHIKVDQLTLNIIKNTLT